VDNTAIGLNALLANTTGNYNTAVGSKALNTSTTASDCIGLGYQAGRDNHSIRLLAIGYNAGLNNNAWPNTFIGYGSGGTSADITGDQNTAVGYLTLADITTGDGNTIMGYTAGQNITTGTANTYIGSRAGLTPTTGDNNTAIGKDSGYDLTTGSNNTFIGYQAGVTHAPSGSVTTGSNIVCLGNNSVSDLYCADTSISSSDARDKTDVEDFKHGLSWITELRPVTYRWDRRTWYGTDENPKGTPDGSKKRDRIHIGFLAQEAIEVEKKHGYADKKDNMLIANQDEDVNDPSYGYKYERLVPVLVNAIKELSAENTALKARLDAAGL
tara:strand:- start:87 stop:1067 length:981 start_codon:yes stop_codon:yes gene_type:complete